MEEVKILEPSVNVHVFSDKILNHDVYFQVIKLQDSFYLWFGKSNQFGDLSVAMATLKNTTSSTNLIGGNESYSVAMAERLSKKMKKQVFIGGDVSCFDQLQLPLLEERIAEEIQCNPDKF